jgi:hypothetical protein
MAKTVLISEDSIMAMLRELSEDVLADMFSKVLVRSDSSPLTDGEERSYKKALVEYEKGEAVSWQDLKRS